MRHRGIDRSACGGSARARRLGNVLVAAAVLPALMVLPAGSGGLLVHSHDEFGLHAHPVVGDLRPDAASVAHAHAHHHDHGRDHRSPADADASPLDGLIADVADFGGAVLPGADAPAADDADAGIRPPAQAAGYLSAASVTHTVPRTTAAPSCADDPPARARHALDVCVKFLV